MKILIAALLITSLVFQTENTAPAPDLVRDLVRFDQAFVPVWLYAREGNMIKAKAAVMNLEFQWQRFQGRYRDAVASEDWQETFRRVDDWLGDAYVAIDANRSRLAYNQLDYVRYELQQLRSQYRIDYYTDHLYDFFDELTLLSDAASDEMLCMMEWPEFEVQATAALNHWRILMVHPLDAELYGLDLNEERDLRQYQVEVEAALEAFLQAVATADREVVASECLQLEDAFLPLLQLFGNYERLRSFYAEG